LLQIVEGLNDTVAQDQKLASVGAKLDVLIALLRAEGNSAGDHPSERQAGRHHRPPGLETQRCSVG